MAPAAITHGTTDRFMMLDGFSLIETAHAPGTRLNRHEHAHAAITFVLGGSFVEDFGSQRIHECLHNSVLIKPAGAAHSNKYGNRGARSFILECISHTKMFEGLERCVPQVGSASLRPRLTELHAAFRTQAPETRLVAEELAFEVIARARRISPAVEGRPPHWLGLVLDVLRAPQGAPPTLAKLASIAGVHPVYMARAFRRHIGCSIGTYRLRLRLQSAMQKIALPDEPISLIALEAGFADQAHFTRLFKRETGVTPARFRKMLHGVCRTVV